MLFSAGADWHGSAYPIEFLHELRVATFEPFRALLGFDNALQQARVMCRECDVAVFRIAKSRACAIRLSCDPFCVFSTLRLKSAQSGKNAGVVGIDYIAANPSSACESGYRRRSGWFTSKGAKSLTQTSIGLCPATGLRSG